MFDFNNPNWKSLSISFSKDLKFMAWIAWCTDFYFTDYSYEEMLAYIQKIDYEKLKNILVPINKEFFADDSLRLCNVVCIPEKSEILACCLNFKDPFMQETMGYLQHLIIKFDGDLFHSVLFDSKMDLKKRPLKIKNIFLQPCSPKDYLNAYTRYETDFVVNKSQVTQDSTSTDKIKMFDSSVYIGAPGNPDGILIDEDNLKSDYLLILVDCLFSLEGDIKIKQKILKEKFGLESFLIDKMMDDLRNLKAPLLEQMEENMIEQELK